MNGCDAAAAGLTRRSVLAASAAGLIASSASAAAPDHPVLELRQYKVIPGRRDSLITLFEREFVESQEALGMTLVGQFRDIEDSDRFTWMRQFPSMAARGEALNGFYFGPVWQAHRAEANPLLEDNDNVLLLRPAAPDLGFVAPERGRGGKGDHLVVATIHYLWKAPDEGFVRFFRERMRPALEGAGLPVLAAYVPEEAPNNFPRLPVRQGEKLFVWFTRVADRGAFDSATAALGRSTTWKESGAAELADREERAAQLLWLAPTPRSRLR